MTQASTSTVSWRSLSVQDEAALDELYVAAFQLVPAGGGQAGSRASFLDDFPVWNPQLEVSHRRQIGAFSGTKLLAAAGSRLVRLHGMEKDTLIIGGVAVQPGLQGKGLATGAIERLLAIEPDLEEKICVLWGSEKALYGRFGFKDAGIQKRAPLSALQLPASALSIDVGFSDALGSDLARRRHEGIVLGSGEIALIRESKNIQWLHLREGEEAAFVGIGKGIDLPGMIHTWGGSPRLLQCLLFELRTKISEHLEILWHPRHESDFQFLANAKKFDREFLAMIRVGERSGVDPDQLWFWGTDSA